MGSHEINGQNSGAALLTIEKLVYGGDGLGRLPADEHGPGKAVFVPFVLEGEVAEVCLVEEKRGFARAKLNEVKKSSAHRIEPGCPYFRRCGGCHYQHSDYEHQLEIKAAILKENLRRITKLELETDLEIHPSPPWNYRNRTRVKVRNTPQFELGYYAFNSHELLPVETCPISSRSINRAIAALWETGRAGRMLDGIQEIEFFASADDSQLLIEAYGSPEIPAVAAKPWAEGLLAAVPDASGIVLFAQPIRVQGTPVLEPIVTVSSDALIYKTESAAYRVSAGSFFQVNRHLTGELVTVVTAQSGGHTALDLYAGVGLFATVLSRDFERVIAVESSDNSYRDLEHNMPANVKTVHATVEKHLANAAGKSKADLVVVDPPRGGLGAQIVRALVALGSPRLVYVSCDPATLARDLSGLLAGGYRVQQAHLVDLFPQTYHLESVFHLAR